MSISPHVTTEAGHSAKSAGGRLHLNTHTPFTQQCQNGLTMLSRHSMETCQGNKVTCNSSGNTWPQLSQLAEPLLTTPGIRSGISVHNLISTNKKGEKKRKKRKKEMHHQTFTPKSLQKEKATFNIYLISFHILQALVYDHVGHARIEEGPKRVWFFSSFFSFFF